MQRSRSVHRWPLAKPIDSAAPKWRGAGALPDRVDGGTEQRLTFAARSFAVFDCALSTRGPE